MTTPQQPDTGTPPTLAALVKMADRPYDVAGFDERVAVEAEKVEVAYNSISDHDFAYVEVELEVVREAFAALVHDHQLAERDLGKLRQDYGVLVEFVEDLAAHKYEFALDKIAEEARKKLASLQEAEK